MLKVGIQHFCGFLIRQQSNQPQVNIYMRTIICLLLFLQALADRTIIARSGLQSTIITSGYYSSLAGFHNVYHPAMLGSGAFWIWNNEGMQSPPGRTLVFQQLIHSACNAPLELNITADDNFLAYIDGKLLIKGNDWRFIYSVTVNLACGPHNLTFVVTQGYGQFGPGLVYVLSQDQSSCFSCGLNGYWDYDTCSCSCLTVCGCALPQVWFGYPACACRCPSSQLLGGNKQQQQVWDKLLDKYKGQMVESNCPNGQYLNPQTCSCQCKPKFCGERYRWNGDPSVCRCQFTP